MKYAKFIFSTNESKNKGGYNARSNIRHVFGRDASQVTVLKCPTVCPTLCMGDRKIIGSLRVCLREMVRLRSVHTTLRACLTLRFSHLYGSLASLNVSPFVSPSGYVSGGRGTHGTPGVGGLLHAKARAF